MKKQKQSAMFGPGIVKTVSILEDRIPNRKYPFNIPAVQEFGTRDLNPKVTFFIGENGSGKSTIIEAIAVSAGMNAEGGSKNHNFATRNSVSSLHGAIQLCRGIHREKDAFFLRAESLYNVTTNLEEIGIGFSSYGGRSLHDQSHGESFLSLINHRFGNEGFYLLDEPESALSPARQLSLLQIIHDHVENRGSQFVIATHSPILMAYPGATIYELSDEGIAPIAYEDTEHYRVTKDFLQNPDVFLHHLISEQ